MRITFFKTPRPKEFNYIPRYWDEQKEESEERKRRIERELGIENSDGGKFKTSIRKGSISSRISERRKANRTSVIRLLVIVLILMALAYYLMTGSFSFNF